MNRPRLLIAALLFLAIPAFATGPTTRANDDSCDIAQLPAATLLLPYFEVDITDVRNQVTLFSVTNVASTAQIARVTLWTDYAYPVASFDLYLTGYDVQSISLYDVLASGVIGNGNGTGSTKSHQGDYSDPNPALEASSCGELPGKIPNPILARMQSALILGRIDGTCNRVGNTHVLAAGYITIDVVGNCSGALPTDPEYFANDIRYDNVLIGDYSQVSGILKYAQVNPLVHIRAVPEGGTPASRAANATTYGNRFQHTFYERYQNASTRTADARQPLPSRFAMRWINGGGGFFETTYKVWRQSVSGKDISCTALTDNRDLIFSDSVAFDEEENAEGDDHFCPAEFCSVFPGRTLPVASRLSIENDEVLPQVLLQGTDAGWLYLNLDDDSVDDGANQAWVVVSMSAQNDFSGDMDATALGNGCSPAVGTAEESADGTVVIGPSENGAQ